MDGIGESHTYSIHSIVNHETNNISNFSKLNDIMYISSSYG